MRAVSEMQRAQGSACLVTSAGGLVEDSLAPRTIAGLMRPLPNSVSISRRSDSIACASRNARSFRPFRAVGRYSADATRRERASASSLALMRTATSRSSCSGRHGFIRYEAAPAETAARFRCALRSWPVSARGRLPRRDRAGWRRDATPAATSMMQSRRLKFSSWQSPVVELLARTDRRSEAHETPGETCNGNARESALRVAYHGPS